MLKRVARMWWVAAWAVAGCADAGGAADAMPAQPDDGGLDAAVAAFDGGDPRVHCPVTRENEGVLSASCPGIAMSGTTCEPLGSTCLGYHADPSTGGTLQVCTAQCGEVATEASTGVWSVSCTSYCNHACDEAPAGGTVFELDVSGCAGRQLTSCDGASHSTLQGQLDRQLRVLVPEIDSLELQNDALVVGFEDGCPARFYAQSGRALPQLEPAARQALGGLRLSCAIALECAEVLGPSTIASP